MFNLDPNLECVGWLVRHGELSNMTVWDSWGNLGLSDEGRQQAEKAAQWLSFERIGRVICSDVPRSIESAEFLMDTGAVLCPYLGSDPNLRPWYVSDFSGKEKSPENLAKFKPYTDDPSLQIPGGESRNQSGERIQVAWQYFMSPYKGLPTVLYVHNSVIKALMGLDEIKYAVSPGGVVAVLINSRGEFSFQIMVGDMNLERGVS